MIGEADYRNVTSAVRTPRFAVLIDEANPHWRTIITSLVRIFSGAWGGKYFLIIPTDGKHIKDKHWEILEAYSPDYLGTYRMTLADFEEADFDFYKRQIDRWRKEWKFDQDFNEWFAKQKYLTSFGVFEIDAELKQELVNRLAPMHLGNNDLAVRFHLIRDHDAGFPFTKIADIVPNAHRRTSKIVLPGRIIDHDLRAMILSQTGDLSQVTLDKYIDQDIPVASLTNEYPVEDMIEWAMQGSVDLMRLRSGSASNRRASSLTAALADSVRHLPFQASMLQLIRYYRIETHRDWQEPITVIVGDTVDDFCFYYNLSRLHDGVFWLPQKWLEDHARRRTNNLRLRSRGRPTLPYSERGRAVQAVVQLAQRAIGYGQEERWLELRSMSLDISSLKQSLRMMAHAYWGGRAEFVRRSRAIPLHEPSTTCVGRVLEENNFTNQQEMVFVGGKSVGNVATPKPKNFSVVDPMNHRWMTSLRISEYNAPPLASLDGRIALTHESRAAKDGVTYLCPSIAYFGGDIDAILTRPQLTIVSAEETMQLYFASAGLKIRQSDKGNYLADTVARFGDLGSAARFIAGENARAILDLFKAEISAADDSVVYLRPEGGRAFVSYDGIRQCVGDDASVVIDELVGKDILRRGMIFLCLRCRLASWYDLANLTSEFTCRRCDFRQQFTKESWKSPEEPKWYYALAETVYQCYSHNSYLTILTLDFLRRRAKESFAYLSEIDVLNFPVEGRNIEIDIACLLDGQILLGECKTEGLKPSHVSKYEKLATALGRRPDELVFSTIHEQVSEAFRTKIANVAGGSFLTKAELIGK